MLEDVDWSVGVGLAQYRDCWRAVVNTARKRRGIS
jgi:hypothetical protein